MLRSLINQRLGRYYIKELLGRGGMAAVYRASDTVLQRDVALKVLYPQYSDDESLVERFQREAVTAAALEHPHIVPVYDVGEHDGMAYIAMKLLSGQTLQERLQAAGSLGLDELLTLLTPVAAALDYAHRKGVVHRDIKPANIFLSESPDGVRVMLTDFGIAKQLGTPGLTTTGALIGTPDYMAPEQIAGGPVDARTDVYALGMLAYRALTGRRAFEGTTQDVLLGHLYNRPPPPSQLNQALSPAVDAVVDRAIAREADSRYLSAGLFVAALAAAPRAAEVAQRAVTTAAHTAVGLPPALAVATQPQAGRPVPAPTQGASSQAPTQRRSASPPAQPAAGAPRLDSEATSGATTLPGGRRGAGVAPWIAAIVLALISGGLAVALYVALGRSQAAAGVPTPLPPPPPSAAPSATAPPPPTATEAAVIAVTATPEPATETPAPTTAPPSATVPLVITVAPPALPTVPAPPSSTTTAISTETPSPTASEAATATATPSATATAELVAACDDQLLQGGFGKLYDDNIAVRTRVGCPAEREVAGDGSIQFFERGTMFWWSGNNRTPEADYIYSFFGGDDGEFEALSPAEVSALTPEPTPGPDPDQPVRGFGRVYFLKSGVAERLGAWQSKELELKGVQRAVLQRFEQGLMIYTPIYEPTSERSIFVLYNDGSFERFDDTFGG